MIEDLSKQQLVLLSVLVSFVVSIATGVITFSLLDDHAPETVTQRIDKVVERTIEKVVPSTNTVHTETTTIVRIDEALRNGIAEVEKTILTLKTDMSYQAIPVGGEVAVIASYSPEGDRVGLVESAGATTTAEYIGKDPYSGLTFWKLAKSIPLPKIALAKDIGVGTYYILRQQGSFDTGIISKVNTTKEGNKIIDVEAKAGNGDGGVVYSIFGEVIGIRAPSILGNWYTVGAYLEGPLQEILSPATTTATTTAIQN